MIINVCKRLPTDIFLYISDLMRKIKWNKENAWNATNHSGGEPTKSSAAMPAAMPTTTKSLAAPPTTSEKSTAFSKKTTPFWKTSTKVEKRLYTNRHLKKTGITLNILHTFTKPGTKKCTTSATTRDF